MALVPAKLGDFVANILKAVNENFSELERRKADAADLPTKVSELENDSGFATTGYVDGRVTAVLRYKGTVAARAELPTANNQVGDVWFVTEQNAEFAWQGDRWEELGSTIDLSGYVEKETGKGLSSNDYTTADKEKLAGLANYTLPIAGETLGGVKNGGNIRINADGSMTAPEPGAGVIRVDFTAEDSRWSLTDGLYILTLSAEGKRPLGVYRTMETGDHQVLADLELQGGNILVYSMDKFAGCLLAL